MEGNQVSIKMFVKMVTGHILILIASYSYGDFKEYELATSNLLRSYFLRGHLCFFLYSMYTFFASFLPRLFGFKAIAVDFFSSVGLHYRAFFASVKYTSFSTTIKRAGN